VLANDYRKRDVKAASRAAGHGIRATQRIALHRPLADDA
jgi:hypothetical protein